MREIKFRGRSTDSFEIDATHSIKAGDWIYGYLIIDGSRAYILNRVVESTNEYITIEQWCPVDINTVGQYIGQHDVDGNEVYEDDIVINMREASDDHPYHYRIKYFPQFAMFALATPDGRYMGEINLHDGTPRPIKVVGNAHQNPELLTQDPKRAEGE